MIKHQCLPGAVSYRAFFFYLVFTVFIRSWGRSFLTPLHLLKTYLMQKDVSMEDNAAGICPYGLLGLYSCGAGP